MPNKLTTTDGANPRSSVRIDLRIGGNWSAMGISVCCVLLNRKD